MTADALNAEAQARFKDCLRAYFATGSWNTPETAAYLAANATFEEAEDRESALLTADHDFHVLSNALVIGCPECIG